MGALGNKVAKGIVYSSICFIMVFIAYVTLLLQYEASEHNRGVPAWFILLPLLCFGLSTLFFSLPSSDKIDLPGTPPVIGLIFGIIGMLLVIEVWVPQSNLFRVLGFAYGISAVVLSCHFVSRLRSKKVSSSNNTISSSSPTSPGSDFIVETVVEKPDKIPFTCSQCGLSGNIPKAKLPPDKPKIGIKCPKCGHPQTIDNPEY